MNRAGRWAALKGVVAGVLVVGAAGADTLSLDLEGCLKLALEASPQVQAARWDSVQAAQGWRAVRGESYPQVRFKGNLPSVRDAADYSIVYDPVTGTEGYRRIQSGDEIWTGAVEVEQALPWGATATVSTQLYRNRWHNDRIGSGRDTLEYSLVRRVQLTQPVLSGNPVGRRRKAAELEWRKGMAGHEIAVRNLRYRTTQVFFGLVQALGAWEIARQDLEQGRLSEELARRKLAAGIIPEVELLQIQVDVARREGNLRRAEAQVEDAREQLRIQVGLPEEVVVKPVWEPGELPAPPVVDWTGRRLEVEQLDYTLQSLELQTRARMWEERVTAALTLWYDLDTRRHLLEEVSEPGDRNRGVTLSVEVPVFGFGSTSGRVQELRAQVERTRREQQVRRAELAAELRQTIRNLELARQRLEIAEAALELSERSYQMTAGRFDSGLVDSRELLDAQLELTRTRTEVLNARVDYELARAALERIAPR